MLSFVNNHITNVSESTFKQKITPLILDCFKTEVANTLESITILTTKKEIVNGQLLRLLKNINETTPPNNLVLNIFVNNYSGYTFSPAGVRSIFKTVNIIDAKISKMNDVYVISSSNPNPPIYGWASGPNMLFMKAMTESKRYNTTLVLETDCILYPNWLDKCQKYVENEYFLISGSTYDGSAVMESKDYLMMAHINGVAFYKTGSKVFQYMMISLEQFIRHAVLQKTAFIAYDYAMLQMILTHMQSSNPDTSIFWKQVLRYVFKTSLIVNMSPEKDKDITEEEALSIHKNCVILHKKI